MILLAVNFHYVAAEAATTNDRAIFPVTVEGLESQVRRLGELFEFISLDQLVDAVDGHGPLPELGCVITFDDGLRCQFELAAPVLERLGVPAVYFVPGLPLAEQRALSVHKLHFVRDLLPEADVIDLLERLLGGDVLDTIDPGAAEAMYRYNTPDAARVKYLLNASLTVDQQEGVTAGLFSAIGVDERSFARDLYMDPAQIRELHRRGALGAHGYAHAPLGLLALDAARLDLCRGAEVLRGITGALPLAVSYPYGSVEAVTPSVASIAEDLGFRFAFTMERAFNRTLRDPLLLARVDANDAPGGRSPLFGVAHLFEGHGMNSARARYIAETEV